jgi:molybdate transport system regulatory protein
MATRSRANAGKQSKPPNPGPELRLRIVLGKDIAIGPGKADLLEAIRETGSITAAGRAMQMSYKRCGGSCHQILR